MKKFVLALALVAAFAFAQDSKPKEYKPTEIQQLKLLSTHKDLVIQSQQMQLLQQQYNQVVAANQQSQHEYSELAEQIRKDNKWDDAEFDPQTGTFHQKPAAPKPEAAKK